MKFVALPNNYFLLKRHVLWQREIEILMKKCKINLNVAQYKYQLTKHLCISFIMKVLYDATCSKSIFDVNFIKLPNEM